MGPLLLHKDKDIKRVENCPDVEKLTDVIHHRLQGLELIILKASQRRQTILVIFFRSESVA